MRFVAGVLSPAVLLAALLVTPGCGQRSAAEAPAAVRTSLSPTERGEQRARDDLAAGKMRIFEYGSPLTSLKARRDAASGLPLRTLIDCCVTAESRQETAAYNLVMRDAARRLPASTPGASRR